MPVVNGIAAKVKDSIHGPYIDRMLDLGMNPRAIHAELCKEEPGFNDFGITTLYAYAQERETLIAAAKSMSMEDAGIDVEKAPRNDAQVLDYVIATGMRNLENTGGDSVKLGDIFQAMALKTKILGTDYKGQTLWFQLEKQQALEEVFEIIKVTCNAVDFAKIQEECIRRGLATPADLGQGYSAEVEML